MAETYQTCRHFRRHYVKMGWRYDPISQGHCVYPRLKPRRRTPLPAPTTVLGRTHKKADRQKPVRFL